MKTILRIMAITAMLSATVTSADAQKNSFKYTDERFADLQMLRYEVKGFEKLSLNQKIFIYHLQEAALLGRDILFDQNGCYNLRLRAIFEAIYTDFKGDRESNDFKEFTVYLKRMWFSNGIHHHYGCEKFVPGFSREWFTDAATGVMKDNKTLAAYIPQLEELTEVIFNPNTLQKRVNLAEGQDLVATSASNYYQGVTQTEAEDFYTALKDNDDPHPVMFGMNSRLVKKDGKVQEIRWTTEGLYGEALRRIVAKLEDARPYAEDAAQQNVIDLLIKYYRTGDLHTFDEYSIAWAGNTEPLIDFVNGFIECYGDPLGLKCSWESIVNFKDLEATRRTETLSKNAQWFEDHSPVDPRFRKAKVKGISAKVITAAILGGDLYPSSAIGINLPNSDWVRREHGSKSVTIGNLTEAYNMAAKGSGFSKEFTINDEMRELMDKYGDITDDLHTDLHECLGHGSGQLLEGVDPDSLKAYGSTIEEARADLFGLYYLADPKMQELGLVPDAEAYKAQYYSYMQNGLLTQLVRIQPGNNIEEAHMRNRSLIAHWCYEQGKAENVVAFVHRDGKTYVQVNDFAKLRTLFGRLLAEIQRIKSEGDYEAAKNLVETYGVKVDPELHREILERYNRLNLAPYKGFINPVYTAVRDREGKITDVTVSYGEGYAEQMLRYSTNYKTLPLVN